MAKRRSTKTTVFEPDIYKLREACSKLRGMSYLIELCGNLPLTPLDEDDCFYGIALVLNQIHEELTSFARAIESHEIAQVQRKSGNPVNLTDNEDFKL